MKNIILLVAAAYQASALKITSTVEASSTTEASVYSSAERPPPLESVFNALNLNLTSQIPTTKPQEMDHLLCLLEANNGTVGWRTLNCDRWLSMGGNSTNATSSSTPTWDLAGRPSWAAALPAMPSNHSTDTVGGSNSSGTGGWTRVRHTPSGATSWGPFRDRCNGTEVVGDPLNDALPWTVRFDNLPFTEMLFATGSLN